MSAALHITREPGTTGPVPEDFTQFCMDQVLRYEPGNGCWYGRFTEVSPVWVYSPHVKGVLPAHRLFAGYLIPDAPWMFWNRVVPADRYLDLSPMYRIERREERSS